MAFGSMDSGDDNEPVAEINMVPLIDVMLVLLIIFIVTAPLLGHAVKVDLPKAVSTPVLPEPESVQLAIDSDGRVHWNGEKVDADQLTERLSTAATLLPQPELHLRADGAVRYERVAQVLSEAARHGLGRIGFVTDPTQVP